MGRQTRVDRDMLINEQNSTVRRSTVKFDLLKPKFHPGQLRAYSSSKRIVLMCCGTGGGKSLIGSYKIAKQASLHGSEKVNLISVAPTFPIMWQSTFFAMDNLLPLLGWQFCPGQDKKYWEHSKYGARIWVRTGTNPNAIEGIPNVVYIWGDEAGQFTRQFWMNLQTRTAFRQAQIFLTTTPYNPVWILRDIIQPVEKTGKKEIVKASIRGADVEFTYGETPDIDYINFPSVANPAFPMEEYERQKRILDPLVFARRFEGKYTRMLGLVYSSYGSHLFVDPRELPAGTRFYAGVDWGYSNDPFAVVVRGVAPTGEHFDVKAYKGYYKTISDKIQILRGFRAIWPICLHICDKSSPADIAELNKAKLVAIPSSNPSGPYRVESGIEKHVELMRSGKYKILSDCGADLDDEYSTYVRDEESGKPVDENNHLMDCVRMLSEYLSQFDAGKKSPTSPNILKKQDKKISPWDS